MASIDDINSNTCAIIVKRAFAGAAVLLLLIAVVIARAQELAQAKARRGFRRPYHRAYRIRSAESTLSTDPSWNDCSLSMLVPASSDRDPHGH